MLKGSVLISIEIPSLERFCYPKSRFGRGSVAVRSRLGRGSVPVRSRFGRSSGFRFGSVRVPLRFPNRL